MIQYVHTHLLQCSSTWFWRANGLEALSKEERGPTRFELGLIRLVCKAYIIYV